MEVSMKWFSGRKGYENGWPITYVSSEEIDAKFVGGWRLFFYNTKARLRLVWSGICTIFSALL